jgi:UDP-N-acetylglucosamine 2-epimerase/N-acetylmannosamine kinase
MRSRRKICVVVTARPSYSRVKSALEKIRAHPELELQIIVTASAIIGRYGDISKVMHADGFEISARALTLVDGEYPEAMAKTVGLGIIELSTLFSAHMPDAVITIADRYETIATAIAASYLNIPLIHIQGGEVTGNIDEKVRHSITKLSDIHFVANEDARRRVVKLGENETVVFNTGCPSIDLAKESLRHPPVDLTEVIKRYGGVGTALNSEEDYIIVIQHPVTTEYSEAQRQIHETLTSVHGTQKQAIWLWPNPDAGSDATSKGIRHFRECHLHNRIHFFRNIDPGIFLRLLRNAKCIVGNSSVAIRECAYLGIPAVNIGSRQENRQRGKNVIDVKYDSTEISQAIALQISKYGTLRADHIYGDGNSGERIANLCAQINLSSAKCITY